MLENMYANRRTYEMADGAFMVASVTTYSYLGGVGMDVHYSEGKSMRRNEMKRTCRRRN
jgi:hypothetical protein